MIVMMGVSGSGKTTAGRALADALGVPFQEGDDLHPSANTDKMRCGIPLDDADRAPWLDALADWIRHQVAAGDGGVLSCSALKRAYRDRLRAAGDADLQFVLLDEPEDVLRNRLKHRGDHFMPITLLTSQLATLERPTPDEQALVLFDAGGSTAQVQAIMEWLATR